MGCCLNAIQSETFSVLYVKEKQPEMPSVDIDKEKPKGPGVLERFARKLCCCNSSVKPESSIELTRAQVVTEEPTSSRISVINNDVFNEDRDDHNFHSVELQVPDAKNKITRNGNNKSSNVSNETIERKSEHFVFVDGVESPTEEIPPDTEFLNVIEEATDSDITPPFNNTNSWLQKSVPNGDATESTAKTPQSNGETIIKEETAAPKSDAETKSSDDITVLVGETTAPVVDGDFNIYRLDRIPELDETEDKRTPWSPQKPPRRASQLLIPLVIQPSEECAVEGIPTDSETQGTVSTDDKNVSNIVLTREHDLEHEELQALLHPEATHADSVLIIANGSLNDSKRETSENKKDIEQIDEAAENTTEIIRSVGTIANDDTLESDYEDSQSTSMTEKSYTDDGSETLQKDYVTRLSVRSNGEILMSSPANNGPVVKVKLGSIKEGIQTYKEEDFSGNIV